MNGKTAVVTGSSSGIGRATALRLAAAGAHVLVHARTNEQGAQEIANEIRQHGVESAILLADLGRIEEQDRFVAEAWNWRSRIDILVNNAGADTLTGAAGRWPYEAKLSALWEVDVVATIRLTRLVGTHMKGHGHGTIVNIGWDQAEHGMAGDSGELFAATKGAVMAFTRSAAQSLAPEVRVNCVAPGWIKTSWGERASRHWQERAVDESLLGRWGTPEDVAAAVEFLVSSDAAFVTGQIVTVNGGWKRA
jgi:3-oxoacyl-[acyl-carrier protein] reductase